MERTVSDNGGTPAGPVLSQYRACSALRKSETSRPISGRSHNMEGFEYLLVEPACELNEKGTREKNDGNDTDEGSFAEEEWNDPEQNEAPKWTEPDLPMTTGTRKGDRKRTGMRYNMYSDNFLIDNIQADEIGEELVNVGELVADEEWQIINDSELSL